MTHKDDAGKKNKKKLACRELPSQYHPRVRCRKTKRIKKKRIWLRRESPSQYHPRVRYRKKTKNVQIQVFWLSDGRIYKQCACPCLSWIRPSKVHHPSVILVFWQLSCNFPTPPKVQTGHQSPGNAHKDDGTIILVKRMTILVAKFPQGWSS